MFERRLRILMITSLPYFSDSGGQVRIYEEARALTRRGHTVKIVSRQGGREMPGVPAVPAPRSPLLRFAADRPTLRAYCPDPSLLSQALKEARAFRPHLIHAHLHGGAWVGARLKKKLNFPLLFDHQGSMTGEMIDLGLLRHGSLLHKLFLRLEHRINHGAADCVATRSAPLARDLVNQWGLPTSMVQSLPDGVDVSLFRPQNREETRAKLRLPANTPLAVYLGALNKNQNIDTLLSAIIQLKATGSPLRFLIMGFPEAEYRARAHDLGIERMITFTGQVDYTKAPLFISAGDCAVSPTCHPLQPNSKLLGYMACGLSTVAFDTPLNKELLGDGGVYAQRDDAADLANRLTWLINNPGEGNRIGLLARQRAEQRHSWDIRGKLLDDIYREKLRR